MGPRFCQQARAQSLPARLAAIGAGGDAGAADAAPAGPTELVSDLYQRFDSNCGSCHGTVQGLGGFQIQSLQAFETLSSPPWPVVLQHVMSDGPSPGHMALDPTDPNDPMPPFPPNSPAGKPYSQRDPTDPIYVFGQLLKQWLAAKMPASFVTAATTGQAGGMAQTTIPIPTAEIGNAMTNIGNCVPTKDLVGSEGTQSAALDAKFAAAKAVPAGSGVSAAQMIGLPEHLAETDLITFDSAILARYGVIAYAPGYPLWSDNAGKLRYIRVPRGTSVQFDKATQSFTIPPNTRFYKTFLKQVVDADGSLRYRKIETRLIVSRPDAKNADGTTSPAALFGSYQWNDDESDAVLVQTPLNSGEPFADTLFQYVVDEPLAADLMKASPADVGEALLEGGAARHYAIPSSERCTQCHEGSESQSFVLGFMPLQINRRLPGVGGVIESTGPDELTQLQRFIDYGLITGIDSPNDVLPLEQSEGSRTPRNDEELVAQGYMLGNCAHCHNPNGFPSLQNPVLTNILNFVPGPDGGIFQFPLEQSSPRIFRGPIGQTPIPYITPSLMDLPRFDLAGAPVGDPFTVDGDGYIVDAMYAPWRSLIYRNVDNPFAYTDDLALYPHMPMNTPGYDPRAKQIMSDWMVSIPAVRKNPDTSEYAFYSSVDSAVFGGSTVDTNPQPYVEVFPGDPRYDDARLAAQQRLAILHSGVNDNLPSGDANTIVYSRYADPGETADILDPAVVADPACHPVPLPPAVTPFSANAIPEHDHWVITDSTQTPGPWSPRRPDWATALAYEMPPAATNSCGQDPTSVLEAQQDEKDAIAALQSVTLANAQDYLTTPVPFGLWQKKPGCDFSSVPTVGPLTGASQPLWVSQAQGLSPGDPVYEQSPGEAVFKMICINCHGPKADANGRLARNLAIMSGGLAEVADFRDGLFGPVGSSPETSNIHRVFGSAALPASWASVPDDDRAARYMAWMALGGTKVKIPAAILEIVAVTQVLDQHRGLFGSPVSGNMLSTAKGLCTVLLGAQEYENALFDPTNPTAYSKTLIHSNGDAELWLHLCSLNNPSPVHVIGVSTQGPSVTAMVDIPFGPGGLFVSNIGANSLLHAASYPPSAPVGNDRGGTDPGLQPDNLWPWCAYATSGSLPANLPACPPAIVTAANSVTPDEADAWAVRGAINAGLGVFTYVESLETRDPPPDYNQCEQLP